MALSILSFIYLSLIFVHDPLSIYYDAFTWSLIGLFTIYYVFPRDIPSLKYVSLIDIKLKINYKL